MLPMTKRLSMKRLYINFFLESFSIYPLPFFPPHIMFIINRSMVKIQFVKKSQTKTIIQTFTSLECVFFYSIFFSLFIKKNSKQISSADILTGNRGLSPFQITER